MWARLPVSLIVQHIRALHWNKSFHGSLPKAPSTATRVEAMPKIMRERSMEKMTCEVRQVLSATSLQDLYAE